MWHKKKIKQDKVIVFVIENREDLKNTVHKLIVACTDICLKLIDVYEKLGGDDGEFCEEISFDNDSELPVTDEEIAAIQNEMKKRN